MATDTKYTPVPFLYRSKGLIAREITDRAPENTYLNLMNCQEREEEAMSSRYGIQIINRDPLGGVSNYPFPASVNSLSRLTYQGNVWRYAGTTNGVLWRRPGNNQGPYTPIYTGLSGNPFETVIDSCFETSQPYLFIADASTSLKDAGTGTPQLWGIDASPYTMNVNPYAPLLLMIESFASNSPGFATSNMNTWGWGPLVTLSSSPGVFPVTGSYDGTQITSDFTQFFNISPLGGGTTTYSISGSTSVSSIISGASPEPPQIEYSTILSGFPNIVLSTGQTVTLNVTCGGSVTLGGDAYYMYGTVQVVYSPDGGNTWNTMYNQTLSYPSTSETFSPTVISVSFTTSNIDQIQVQCISTSASGGTPGYGGYNVDTVTNASGLSVQITSPGAFGPVVNGMVSVLTTPFPNVSNYPISSIISTNQDNNGIYDDLLVVTTASNSYSAGNSIAIYACPNESLDGFYSIATLPSGTSLTVPYYSATQIGALNTATQNGYVTGGLSNAPACVLTNQYSTPYPTQMDAYGFYQWVNPSTTNFPIGQWSGVIPCVSNVPTQGWIAKSFSSPLDLTQGGQVTDDDLIVLTLLTSNPTGIEQVELRFYVGSSSASTTETSYYTKFISPAYYQGAIAGSTLAYAATQAQIYADTLDLITGQTPDTTSAQLQPSNFGTGQGSWEACYLRVGDFLPVGQAGQSGLNWANTTSWQLVVTTSGLVTPTIGISVNGLYLQWGYGPSSFGGVGYDYRYTYYNANTGTESSPCPEQTFNEDYGYLASLAAPIFLRQAAQCVGYYSNDTQVTHVRVYRRGGNLASNWFQVAQIQNVAGAGQFVYKDVVADAYLQEAPPLVLDNDPPVTSSLVSPIQTTLSSSLAPPGNSIHSIFTPQIATVTQANAVFAVNEIVIIGNSSNLEEVAVIAGGVGQFTAIFRLEHNLGDPVTVEAIPRQPCNLCALAYGQIWLAGDPNNPGYLYYSKEDQPENFGPENFISVSSPSDPINAIINWRGTLYVGTLTTWYVIQGGAEPIAQPTGSQHGIVAQGGWTQTEGAIWYRAADGLREFRGSEGTYMSLPIEWIYRNNPLTPLPLANVSTASQDVMAYFNNQVYNSYISTSGQRYRIIYDTIYQRYRIDSLPMTAMLWERDTNDFLGALQWNVSSSAQGYMIVADQQYNQDYDDGGYNPLNYPAIISNITTGGWTYPLYALSLSLSQYAQVNTNQSGNQLVCTVAPMSIPLGTTVTGLGVTFTAKNFGGSYVSAQFDFTSGFSSQYQTAPLTSALTNYSLGGPTNQWGVALTPTLLNAGFTLYVDSQYKQFGFGGTSLNSLVVTAYVSNGGAIGLIENPITITIQTPYEDLKKPHFPKQFNIIETDVNTQNQSMATTLLFDEATTVLNLPNATTTQRQKVELPVNAGAGQQAYRMSLEHSMSVSTAPIFYQENVYAADLAAFRYSFDTYWILGGNDLHKLVKQCVFDYTSALPLTFNLYADMQTTPYYTFTLPAQPNRASIRVRFPALKMRLFRMIGNIPSGTVGFQMWSAPQLWWKACLESTGYKPTDLVT